MEKTQIPTQKERDDMVRETAYRATIATYRISDTRRNVENELAILKTQLNILTVDRADLVDLLRRSRVNGADPITDVEKTLLKVIAKQKQVRAIGWDLSLALERIVETFDTQPIDVSIKAKEESDK